jgi:calcium binding protein 39
MNCFCFEQEVVTRHKSTVADFFSKNYDWVSALSLKLFKVSAYVTLAKNISINHEILLKPHIFQFFAEFNSKLILSASNYIIRRQSIQVRFFHL